MAPNGVVTSEGPPAATADAATVIHRADFFAAIVLVLMLLAIVFTVLISEQHATIDAATASAEIDGTPAPAEPAPALPPAP